MYIYASQIEKPFQWSVDDLRINPMVARWIVHQDLDGKTVSHGKALLQRMVKGSTDSPLYVTPVLPQSLFIGWRPKIGFCIDLYGNKLVLDPKAISTLLWQGGNEGTTSLAQQQQTNGTNVLAPWWTIWQHQCSFERPARSQWWLIQMGGEGKHDHFGGRHQGYLFNTKYACAARKEIHLCFIEWGDTINGCQFFLDAANWW